MSNETGFTTMARARAEGERPTIGVGMLGYGFMGKAHTAAYKTIPYMVYPPPAVPELVAICGRNRKRAEEMAGKYGVPAVFADYRKMIECDGIAIWSNDEITLSGQTPTEREVKDLVGFINRTSPGRICASAEIGKIYASGESFRDRAAGFLAIPISRTPGR